MTKPTQQNTKQAFPPGPNTIFWCILLQINMKTQLWLIWMTALIQHLMAETSPITFGAAAESELSNCYGKSCAHFTNGETQLLESTSVESAANFVVQSLKESTTNSIYKESLELRAIHSASFVDGLYHSNILLTVELASAHFDSGNETELFEIIVLESKLENDKGEEDEVAAIRRGYAIDRFPKMKIEEINSALQRSINQTVERNKKIRSWAS